MQNLTISLCHKEIGNVSSDAILVTDCIAAKDFLEPVATSGSVKVDRPANSRPGVNQSSVTILPLGHRNHLWS